MDDVSVGKASSIVKKRKTVSVTPEKASKTPTKKLKTVDVTPTKSFKEETKVASKARKTGAFGGVSPLFEAPSTHRSRASS